MPKTKYRVTITKDLEDWWGFDELFGDPACSREKAEENAINILNEDVGAMLEGATYKIELIHVR